MSAETADWQLPGLTIREAARLLRAAELSPVELTRAVLARIEQTEPAIHAYVAVQADEALASAERAQAELRTGQDRGPLHGIPIGIKDIADVRGVPTRCGSRARERIAPAATDAEVVARLRAAGAIPIGKTVTQEFAAGVVSVPARNPWDPRRIPGGSSGGSGAAVAAGSCLAALGSDTGGSIRIPASVNGVTGLKPTFGTVSTRGVYPLSWSLDTVGPLARTVDDAALFYDAIGTRGPSIGNVAEAPGGESLRGVRLGVARGYFDEQLQPAVRPAVAAALAVLADLGAELVDVDWREARAARAAAFLISRVETVAVHAPTVRDAGDLLGPDLRLRIEAGALMPASVYLRALRARSAVKRAIAELFWAHRLDALVTPTLPGTAALADDLTIRYEDGTVDPVGTAYTRFTMPFNATGQPVLSLPCGFDGTGLPVGLQMAGKPFGEAALCRIGIAFEQAAGWVRHRPAR